MGVLTRCEASPQNFASCETESPCPFNTSFLLPSPKPPGTAVPLSVSVSPTTLRGGVIRDFSFCAWLLSRSMMSSRFAHAVTCDRVSSPFKANISLVCTPRCVCPLASPWAFGPLLPLGVYDQCCCEHRCVNVRSRPCLQWFWFWICTWSWDCSVIQEFYF